MATYRVFGVIRDESGQPKSGVKITIEQEGLDGALMALGAPATDAKGEYELQYSPPVTDGLTLRVSLPGESGNPSRRIVSPAEQQALDIRLGAKSEFAPIPHYAVISERMQKVLGPAKLELEKLDRVGVARVAAAAGVHPREVALAREARVSGGLVKLPPAVFFALGQAGLSAAVADVLKHSSDDRKAALDRAVANGVLTQADAEGAHQALKDLDDVAIDSAAAGSQAVANPGFALDLAGVFDPADRREVLEAWRDHKGPPSEFWKNPPPPIAKDTPKVQFALQLHTLTRAHAPLIQTLFNKHQSLDELATMDPVAWTKLIDEHGYPDHIVAAGLQGEYPKALFTAIEDAFPTRMLSARSGWFESGTGLQSFLDGNSAYDLRGMTFRAFLRQHPDALEVIADEKQRDMVAKELPVLERLYRVSGKGARFETMRGLLDAGIKSAAQIQNMGRSRFVDMLGPTLGVSEAKAVFRRARYLSGLAVSLQAQHGSSAPVTQMACLPILGEGRPEGDDDIVGWDALFGGGTFCACEECQSSHGPSAYLADLMFWLDGGASAGSLGAALRARRPDLENIELSCKNANTAMRALDLLLERLEHALDPSAPETEQTTEDEADLAARPEHRHEPAYDKLAGADVPIFYPFEQPYVSSLDQVRAFLKALGSERAVALLTLAGADAMSGLSNPEIAAEILGMSRTSWSILTGVRAAETSVRWGLETDAVDPLRAVPAFLRQAGHRASEHPLTYAELEELLRSQYVQDVGTLSILFDNEVCDASSATLVSAAFPAHLDRLAKLIRLSRDLGWSIRDVDRAIESFRQSVSTGPLAETDISEHLLLSLASVDWLERTLGHSPAELLDFWSPLDTRRWAERIQDDPSSAGLGRIPWPNSANAGGADAEPSPFQRMVGSVDDADLFRVNDAGTALVDESRLIRDHVDAVASVVGATPAELMPLLDDLGADPTITLAALSQLHRRVRLARSLGLSTTELLIWQGWTGIDPFASPLVTVQFVVEVQRQASFRVSADALQEVLVPADRRDLLRVGLPSAGAAMLALSDEVRQHRAVLGADGQPLPATSPADRDRAIIRRVAALLDIDAALADGLLSKMTYGGLSLRDAVITAAVSLSDLREAAPDSYTTEEDVAAVTDVALWELVAVSVWICSSFGIRAEDLGWLLGPSAARGFELETIITGPDASARYTAWARFREAARLQSVAHERKLFDLLGALLDGAITDAKSLREALAARTGWSLEDLEAAIDDDFTGPIGPDTPNTPAAWAEPGRLAQLAAWMELAHTLGVSAIKLWSWSESVWTNDGLFTEPLDAYKAQAAEIEQTLRAAWGEARWLAEMPAIRDALRERQRVALVSRIVGEPGSPYDSPDGLGQALVMDVHMGACGRTSRIKDAIRTVQIFVQRVLLGEEGALHLTEEEAKEWVWRKNYRVWEANRKVFLYPENWLLPELRAAKTPFFEQLESQLAQGALTDVHVEDAFRTYLRDLATVSKLDALTVLREPQDVGEDVYHVFARTHGIPPTYYHRKRVDGGRWTPWEMIPKVEGEHLIPVVYQRRLRLFWLSFSETAVQPTSTPIPGIGHAIDRPERYFQLRLSWTELRDGAWSAPTESEAFIGIDQRGEKQPSGVELANLVVAESSTTVTPTSFHAAVTIDDNGRDLLVDVFRDRTAMSDGSRGPVRLACFRMSSIDGKVSTEVQKSSSIEHTEGPSSLASLYPGRAQRFELHESGITDIGADLILPLPNASTGSPVSQKVLISDAQPWARVTPVQRVAFDPMEPFVFEDAIGSYWVSADSALQLKDPNAIRFEMGLFVNGPLAMSPAVRAVSAEQMEFIQPDEPVLRNVGEDGMDYLVGDAVWSFAKGTSNVTMVNKTAVNRQATAYGVNTYIEIVDETGAVLYEGCAGSDSDPKSRPDTMAVLAMTYEAPPVSVNATKTSEGLHYLRTDLGSYRFQTFFHPHVAVMREALNEGGVFGLLDPADGEPLAGQDPSPMSTLASRYDLLAVSYPRPADDLDFSARGTYSAYNWELFFHAPFLIASRLHEAGRFDEALKWLHVIFNPFRPAQAGEGASDAARSYWRFRPFREMFATDTDAPRNIQELLAVLTADGADPEAVETAKDVLQQIADWRRSPFDPHAIAQTRLITYMTAVVMRYLDVLIDWGDQLFARDTLESVSEAAELYMLAARILGARPEGIEVQRPAPMTFAQMLAKFEAGVGPAETLEEALPDAWEIAADDFPAEANSLPTLLYFCTPHNPQLVSRFWDRVADRLFKIRHCLNLEGERRELALFEPPIDPALLVRGAASGVDLGTLLSDVTASEVPHRRYASMAELAAGLAANTHSLGQALLNAFEKRDADELAVLRTEHERRLQEDTVQLRTDQIRELKEQLAALRHTREATQKRLTFYEDKPRTNAKEDEHRARATKAAHFTGDAIPRYIAAPIMGMIPQMDIGTAGAGGSPKVTASFGGAQFAAMESAAAQVLNTRASVEGHKGQLALTEAGYDRRQEQWQLQAATLADELAAIDRRIAAAEIQLAMAENTLATAELRMSQTEEIQRVLERRFGRKELYHWLAGQLSGLHYQSYQLAYEFAKRAQRAWQYELGRDDSFIQFGYWDGGRKGLLAAERLTHDLRRMQVAYADISKRRLEVDQTFSLRDVDPVALVRLQKTGEASLRLSEPFFDLYYPGHFRRRIRAVRLTVPAVVPPNTNLPVHLTLEGHRIRTSDTAVKEGGHGDSPVTSMATSTGQRDAGVFEINFSGARLLPFEGAGAISDWNIKLPSPKALPAFDYQQIQDVLVHVAYDADYSGTRRSALETGAPPAIRTNLFSTPIRRVINLRREHGGAFRRLLQAASGEAIPVEITKDVLPSYLRLLPSDVTLEVRGTPFIAINATAANGLALTLESPTGATTVAGAGWGAWTDTDGTSLEMLQGEVSTLAGAVQGGLIGTHTLRATWGSFVPGDDFDILIVVELDQVMIP